MNEPIFQIKSEEKKANFERFVISPLEQGYGHTLGNSLRRVLLTSLPGAAAVSVRIAGVKHSFSTLKGMKEDVVEFLLNLKKVRFEYTGEGSAKATISVKGKKEVTAADIQTDATLKVANPELLLASLNSDAKLEVKIDIEKGVGYSPAEEREGGEIGLIPVDAAFSPVVRVNYKVEETRVGRLTNYDKLVLELWTDGTVDPKEALVTSANILTSYYGQIISPKEVKEVKKVEKSTLGTVGKLSVEEINLPTRVANALMKAGFETVEELLAAKRAELVKIRNLGEKSVRIIEAALGERDLAFKGGEEA